MNSKPYKIGNYLIDESEYLGKGQYGIVFGCSQINPNILNIAAKIVPGQFIDDRVIIREREIIQSLMPVDSPNLVKFYDVIQANNQIYMIMEKCDTDLKALMDLKKSQNTWFSIQNSIEFITQCIMGYKVIHELNIIHRDLKPGNLLLKNGQIKISDFGMGRIIEDVNKKFKLTAVGTPAYAAPQLFETSIFSSKADVFSLGVIAFQLIYDGNLPFVAKSLGELRIQLKNLQQNPIQCSLTNKKNESIPQNIRKLIERMLIYDEESRVSWEELFEYIKNPYASGVSKIKILVDNSKDFEEKTNQNTEKNQEQQQNVLNPLIADTMIIAQFQNSSSSTVPSQLSRPERIHRYIGLLLAKGDLAYSLYNNFLQFGEQQKLDYNEIILIGMTLVGYKFTTLLNASGLSNGQLSCVSKVTLESFNLDKLLEAVKQYQQIEQPEFIQMQFEISEQFLIMNEIFVVSNYIDICFSGNAKHDLINLQEKSLKILRYK